MGNYDAVGLNKSIYGSDELESYWNDNDGFNDPEYLMMKAIVELKKNSNVNPDDEVVSRCIAMTGEMKKLYADMTTAKARIRRLINRASEMCRLNLTGTGYLESDWDNGAWCRWWSMSRETWDKLLADNDGNEREALATFGYPSYSEIPGQRFQDAPFAHVGRNRVVVKQRGGWDI